MTKQEELLKQWIDRASYYALLDRWRHAPSGDIMFVGELGQYYSHVMANKKRKLTDAQQVQTSKDVGWTN